jgi:hypothetical protein
MDKHLSLLQSFVNYRRKIFHKIGPRLSKYLASFKLVAGTNTLAHFKGRYSQKTSVITQAPISLTNIRQAVKSCRVQIP